MEAAINYYEHHLGDWAAATGHLTWDEDMAYTRLLRAYYHAERAIPQGQQYRLAKALTPAQRKAVDAVLAEFFVLTGDAYHQKRADAEIVRYQDKQRKAKASANARWNGTERNANALQNAPPNAMRTHSEGNALQTPDTIPNTPLPTVVGSPPQGKTPRASKRCPEDFDPGAEGEAWAREHAPGIDLAAETAKFRDHTFATARGDWRATWRNWLRKAAEDKAAHKARQQPGNTESEWRREQRERMAQFAPGAVEKRGTQNRSHTEIFEASDGAQKLLG